MSCTYDEENDKFINPSPFSDWVLDADDDKLIALIVARDDYKTRLERDAAQEAAGP